MAYYHVEPWGEERLEFMLGQLTALVANIMRPQGVDPMPASTFIPNYLRDPAAEAERFGGYTQVQLQAILDEKERTTMSADDMRRMGL